MPAAIPPFKRLFSNIEKTEIGCWLWLGQVTTKGYGQICAFSKIVAVHRLSYKLYNGEIPPGIEVCHTCDVPNCINPDHLFLGTHADNMADMKKKGRGRGWSSKGILNSRSIPVLVLGKKYGSINEAERELNLSGGLVQSWVKNKPERAKIITREEYFNG